MGKFWKLEQKLRTYKTLTRFIQILNAISSVRFKRFKNQILPTVPYHRRLEYLLSQLYSLYPVEKITPLFRKVKHPQKVDLVAFFSSKGFVGDFNHRMEELLNRLRRKLEKEVFTVAVGNRIGTLKDKTVKS